MSNINLDVNAMCFTLPINKYPDVQTLMEDYVKGVLTSYSINTSTKRLCSLYFLSDTRHNTHPFRQLVHEYRSKPPTTPLDPEKYGEITYNGKTYRYKLDCPPTEDSVIDALRKHGDIDQSVDDTLYRAHPGWRSSMMAAIHKCIDKVLLNLSREYKTTLFRHNTRGYINGADVDVKLYPFCEADRSMLACAVPHSCIQTVDWDMYFGALMHANTVTNVRLSKRFLRIDTRYSIRPFDWTFLWFCMCKTDYNIQKVDGEFKFPTLCSVGYPKDLFMIVATRAFPKAPPIVEFGQFEITFNVHNLAYYFRLLEKYNKGHPIPQIISEIVDELSPQEQKAYDKHGKLPDQYMYLTDMTTRRWYGKIKDKPFSTLYHIIERAIFSVVYYATLEDKHHKLVNFPEVVLPRWEFKTVEQFHNNTDPLIYTYTYEQYYESRTDALVAYGLKIPQDVPYTDVKQYVEGLNVDFDLIDPITTSVMATYQTHINDQYNMNQQPAQKPSFKDIFAAKGANVPECNEHAFNELLKFFITVHTTHRDITELTDDTITDELIALFNLEVDGLAKNVLSITNEHERDKRITFFDYDPDSDETHIYKIDRRPVLHNGKSYSSSTFKKLLFDNRSFEFVARNMKPESREKYKHNDGTPMTDEEIVKKWTSNKFAAERGTQCHYGLEAHYNGIPRHIFYYYNDSSEPVELLKQEQKIIDAVVKQNNDMKLVPFRTEMCLYYTFGEENGNTQLDEDSAIFVGQADIVYTFPDGKKGIGDYKFTKNPQKDETRFKCWDFPFMKNVPKTGHGEFSFQLCMYRYVLVNYYGYDIPLKYVFYDWYDLENDKLHRTPVHDCTYEVEEMFKILPQILKHKERVEALPPTCSYRDFKFQGDPRTNVNTKPSSPKRKSEACVFDPVTKKWKSV